ncbi:MAG: sugar isomerase [Candidatus Nephthysia bennettiae]|uniref:SIS domain-containing protein n=1 Tax=Candidatus Nephthysia bennettiae TaxID=3127016 RepID=A0A934K611_9BACT|nr:SIS domain-containing protein [Candidatus Dormibacteraeota bacterium]PZR91996.1 MAG: sugar isomerase [Candidatus Dormibacteraeota bacterium]
MTSFCEEYLAETVAIVGALDRGEIESLASCLAQVRDGQGRLFILGVGGSAAHAGHAVNDFRKLCELEAYAPTDNVSELTARVNDDGWDGSFAAWLEGSRISSRDAVLVFSVGGGSRTPAVSTNIVRAIEAARDAGAHVLGIVGRDGGVTRAAAHACVLIPPLFADRVTPHTEGLCAVVWHLLVSHPRLQRSAGKWESVGGRAEAP